MFYLGTHEPSWLARAGVPLFISRRRLVRQKQLPIAAAPWALDSGAFSELKQHGGWLTTPRQYAAEVRRYQAEIGSLTWVAPQDWMCEPEMLAMTGLTVAGHQWRTTLSFLRLRELLGSLVIPVLQGWQPEDYFHHVLLYEGNGVSLDREAVVGVGSVCRRQDAQAASLIFRQLHDQAGLRSLHGFGVKLDGLHTYGDLLSSADSMAWSYRARHAPPLAGCPHARCSNCLRFALRWRDDRIGNVLGQTRLEVSC